MNFRKWTPDEDVILLNLHDAGKSWAEIGRVLGMQYETCKYRFEKHLNPDSRHVKKRKIVREEPPTITLKFDPKAKLDVRYEDDPRGVLRKDGGIARPPIKTDEDGRPIVVNGKMVWAEPRSRARGEYDWGLNPVDPRRF